MYVKRLLTYPLTPNSRSLLPTGDKLISSLLDETYGRTPKLSCDVLEEEEWGAALVHLAEENNVMQMEFLYGLQMYMNGIGFPKFEGKSVCKELMQAMYKFDVVEAEAVLDYKEDEREEWDEGKTNVIVQCGEFFLWLEEDDDSSEEESEEEDEE